MSDPTETEAKVDTPAEVELNEQTENPVEVVVVEELAEVEAETVETETPAEVLSEVVEDEPEQLSREEFLRVVEEFGSEIAAQTVKDGGSYATALKASHDALKADNEALNAKVTELSESKGGRPAKVVRESDTKSGKLFNTGK